MKSKTGWYRVYLSMVSIEPDPARYKPLKPQYHPHFKVAVDIPDTDEYIIDRGAGKDGTPTLTAKGAVYVQSELAAAQAELYDFSSVDTTIKKNKGVGK